MMPLLIQFVNILTLLRFGKNLIHVVVVRFIIFVVTLHLKNFSVQIVLNYTKF